MAEMTDLAQTIREDIASSGRSRQQLGAAEPVFGVLDSIAPTAGRFFPSETTEAMKFSALTVANSGTPATGIPEGSPKPEGAVIGSMDVDLSALAAYAEATTQQILGSNGLSNALVRLIRSQIIAAYEANVAAAIAASTPDAVSGATFIEALAKGQGELVSRGANPAVLAVGDAYGQVVSEVTAAAGLVSPSEGSVLAVLGSAVYLNAGLGARMFLCDGSALLNVAHTSGLVVNVDNASKAKTNEVAIVVEAFLAPVVQVPDAIVELTVVAGP